MGINIRIELKTAQTFEAETRDFSMMMTTRYKLLTKQSCYLQLSSFLTTEFLTYISFSTRIFFF